MVLPLTHVIVIFLLGAEITTGDFEFSEVGVDGEVEPAAGLADWLVEGLAEVLGEAIGLGVAALLSGS